MHIFSDFFPDVKLSELTGAQLLATNANHHYVKCIDIYPKVNSDLFLAIGQANGRIMLTSFGPSEFEGIGLAGKELGINFYLQLKLVTFFISS